MRCAWLSIRPGRTVLADRSIVRTPDGASETGTTPSIRLPSTMSARSVSTSPAATSTRRPARTTRASAEGIGGAYSRPPPDAGCYRPLPATRIDSVGRYLKRGTAQAPSYDRGRGCLVGGGVAVRGDRPPGGRRRTHLVRPR